MLNALLEPPPPDFYRSGIFIPQLPAVYISLGLKTVKPPVVIDENGDVSLYWSVEAAARALEPIDVKNSEYVAYDSEGFVLTLECRDPCVIITGRAYSQPAPEALVAVLKSFWERTSSTPWPVVSSASQAVAQSCDRFGCDT